MFGWGSLIPAFSRIPSNHWNRSWSHIIDEPGFSMTGVPPMQMVRSIKRIDLKGYSELDGEGFLGMYCGTLVLFYYINSLAPRFEPFTCSPRGWPFSHSRKLHTPWGSGIPCCWYQRSYGSSWSNISPKRTCTHQVFPAGPLLELTWAHHIMLVGSQ